MKLRNRTAHIKPATRNAMLDQLAGIAGGIIAERIAHEMATAIMQARLRPPRRRWWHRLMWWRA